MKRTIFIFLNIAIIAISLLFISCKGKEDEVTSCPKDYEVTSLPGISEALGGGSTVTVSQLNGKSIYTMITAQPAAKPESNSAPSTTYSYTLTTVAGVKSIIAPSIATGSTDSFEESGSALSGEQVYSSAQRNLDLFLREAENQALAGGAKQLAKIPSGIDAAAPAAPVVGTTWNGVYIIAGAPVTISTTCRYVSAHAYFFVDDRNTAAMSSYLASYGTAFDAIYDVNHAKFGTENDTDSNGKVIIVFTQELTGGILGYFYSDDKYPYNVSTNPYSNEGDIFYMTTDTAYQGAVVNGTLAHEFQHMIYFDEHYDRGVTSTYSWLNEALSQAAEYYNNYTDNHLAWISSFLDAGYGGLSLTHWTSNNYGYGAVYIRYLRDRFGDAAIKNMCATNLVGVAAVEAATCTNFNTLFNDFTRALVMSGTGDSSDPKYNFTTLNLQTVQPIGRTGLTTTLSYSAGSGGTATLFPYRLSFLNWTGSFGTMNLSGTDIAGTAFGLSQ